MTNTSLPGTRSVRIRTSALALRAANNRHPNLFSERLVQGDIQFAYI